MSALKIIDFMGKRHIAAVFSVVLIVLSIGSLAVRGLNFGLDFTGGTAVELEFENPLTLEPLRKALVDAGLESAVVVNYGSDTEVMVRFQEKLFADESENNIGEDQQAIEDKDVGKEVAKILNEVTEGEIEVKQSNYIGPQIGEELKNWGGIGMLLALGVVMLYVAIRFQYKFSVGAVVALGHDVLIVLGFFSVLQLDFDLTVLAAVLAVIGYSLNDTIVVSDRIRENFRIVRETAEIDIVNQSLSQTLGRTLMTSGTTLIVLLALFFVGGEMIHNFSIALLIGVGIGTYSSIYVAATILVWMKLSREDLIRPVYSEEEGNLEEIP